MLNFNKSHKVKYNHTEQDEEYRNLKLNTSKEYKANVFIDKETKLNLKSYIWLQRWKLIWHNMSEIILKEE